MTYQPAIPIGNEEVTALHEGELTIQTGQYIQLEWLDRPSRFVGVTPAGSIWATHAHGHRKFLGMVKTFKKFN